MSRSWLLAGATLCAAVLGAGCGSGADAADGRGTVAAETVTAVVDDSSEASGASTGAAGTSEPSAPSVSDVAATTDGQPPTSGEQPVAEQPTPQEQQSAEEPTTGDQPVPEAPTPGDQLAAAESTPEGQPDAGAAGAPATPDIETTPAAVSTTAAEAPSGSDASLGDTGPEPAQPEVAAAVSVFPPLGDSDSVARWTVEIVEWAPHDPHAFTQGLEVADGTMYESTGLWGRSSLRAVDSATGEVTRLVELSDEHFGEGLTVVGDNLIQLTWQAGTAIVYDRDSFAVSGRHDYAGEGWGLCLSDDVLVMSDGSDRLARRDPATFELLGTVELSAPGYEGPLHYLNELECAEGLVIANVWQTERLLVIDPHTGRVVAVVDAGPLVDDVVQNSAAGSIDVLNGVAVSDSDGTLWMTGKLWPRLYRVRIVEMP